MLCKANAMKFSKKIPTKEYAASNLEPLGVGPKSSNSQTLKVSLKPSSKPVYSVPKHLPEDGVKCYRREIVKGVKRAIHFTTFCTNLSLRGGGVQGFAIQTGVA